MSIALMGGATLAIGLLPTYEQIGVAAPMMLVLLRIAQGFSVGGEFTGSMVYTTELAPPGIRGLVSSSSAVGVTLGFILGSLCAWGLRSGLEPEQVAAWGWRVPFIGSVVFLVAGLWLRRGRSSQGADSADFLLANIFSLVLVLVSKPFGGWLSDRVGRRRLMLTLTLATMALVAPALHLMLTGDPWAFALGQMLMAVPLGMALGLHGAMLVEIFPLRTRVTSMSFAYSVTLALAGGTAPLVSAWLVGQFHPLAPAAYMIVLGLPGLLLLGAMRETNSRPLTE